MTPLCVPRCVATQFLIHNSQFSVFADGHSVREIAYLLLYSEQHVFRVLDQAEKKILKR